MRLKKFVALLLSLVIVLAFTACSSGSSGTDNPLLVDEDDDPTAVRTGLGIISEIRTDEKEPDSITKRTFISTVAAVTVDPDGKIICANVDVMEIKADLDVDDGVVISPQTRKELGDNYEMPNETALKSGWSEQIEALEDFAAGKTVDEFRNSVDYFSGIASDSDLLKVCDIDVGTEVKAIVLAASEARTIGAQSKDSVKLAITAENINEDETVGYRMQYAAVTLDKKGVITSCMTDESEGKCTIIDGEYKEFPGIYQTKKQLGVQYAMKSDSSIGLEWNEQINALEEFAIGKTVDELISSVGDDRITNDADLISSCTIEVDMLINNIVKAVNE